MNQNNTSERQNSNTNPISYSSSSLNNPEQMDSTLPKIDRTCLLYKIPKRAKEEELELYILQKFPELGPVQKLAFDRRKNTAMNLGSGSIVLSTKKAAYDLLKTNLILRGKKLTVKLGKIPNSEFAKSDLRRVYFYGDFSEISSKEISDFLLGDFIPIRIILLSDANNNMSKNVGFADFSCKTEAKIFRERFKSGFSVKRTKISLSFCHAMQINSKVLVGLVRNKTKRDFLIPSLLGLLKCKESNYRMNKIVKTKHTK